MLSLHSTGFLVLVFFFCAYLLLTFHLSFIGHLCSVPTSGRSVVMKQVQSKAQKLQSHVCKLGSGSESRRHRAGQRHTCGTIQAEIEGESLRSTAGEQVIAGASHGQRGASSKLAPSPSSRTLGAAGKALRALKTSNAFKNWL